MQRVCAHLVLLDQFAESNNLSIGEANEVVGCVPTLFQFPLKFEISPLVLEWHLVVGLIGSLVEPATDLGGELICAMARTGQSKCALCLSEGECFDLPNRLESSSALLMTKR